MRRSAQPRALERTVTIDRVARIVRAGGVEAAIRPQQRADRILISAQHREQQGLHRWFEAMSASSSPAASSASPGSSVARAAGSQPQDEVVAAQFRPPRAHRFAHHPSHVIAVHRARQLLLADDDNRPGPCRLRWAPQALVRAALPGGAPRGTTWQMPRPRRAAGCDSSRSWARRATSYTASRARPLARRARTPCGRPRSSFGCESRACACGERPMAGKYVS